MGSSVSKAKSFGNQIRRSPLTGTNQTKNNTTSASTSSPLDYSTVNSSHKVLIEENDDISDYLLLHKQQKSSQINDAPSKKTPARAKRNSFFVNMKIGAINNLKIGRINRKPNNGSIAIKKKVHRVNEGSLASRRKGPQFKKAVVTKSIIGRPSNFKHITSTTQQFSSLEKEEAEELATQIIKLAAVVKPLSKAPSLNNKSKRHYSESSITKKKTSIRSRYQQQAESIIVMPDIPPRVSSYANQMYSHEIHIARKPVAFPSVKRVNNKRSATGSKNYGKNSSFGKSSLGRKHNKNYRSSPKKIPTSDDCQ